MTIDRAIEILRRDAAEAYSWEGLMQKLNSGRKLTVKLGADPSRPDLHLGHTVVLRKLRLLQELGHEIVFVIGDFTGMIGDPSGRSKTRPPLTLEQTRINGESYYKQVTKILDPKLTRIEYNSAWLNQMNFADVIMLAGKYTVARILERDDFSNRYQNNQPIGVHEFLYPLAQGYDSVALKADIEVGGTDQTFNLLVGRALMRDYDLPQQEVITFPLLPGLDGVEKMSKSLDNYIGIDEPPEIMYEKSMKIPDSIFMDYIRLTTDLNTDEVNAVFQKDPVEAHRIYAREILRLYHGEDAVEPAERRYVDIARGQTPDQMPEFTIRLGTTLVDALRLADLAKSKSDARRLMTGGGIKVDGDTIFDINLVFARPGAYTVQRGKSRFVRVVVS